MKTPDTAFMKTFLSSDIDAYPVIEPQLPHGERRWHCSREYDDIVWVAQNIVKHRDLNLILFEREAYPFKYGVWL